MSDRKSTYEPNDAGEEPRPLPQPPKDAFPDVPPSKKEAEPPPESASAAQTVTGDGGETELSGRPRETGGERPPKGAPDRA